jgi:4-alpha-glucanotransferase
MGPESRHFIDQMVEMKQSLWQVLPLGPTSYGDSPYQSPSTFAGNPLLISFEDLVAEGLLTPSALKRFGKERWGPVDFGDIIHRRMKILTGVCHSFERRASEELKDAFRSFCLREAPWLDEYAHFMAIKESFDGVPWTEWPEPLGLRHPEAMEESWRQRSAAIHDVKVLQFLFQLQWDKLRSYARDRGIRMVGDIPIFVAHDSSDVWAEPRLFYLEPNGRPSVVAGVPPDYFSATGQLWGNPLYNWSAHRAEGYRWWIRRMQKVFELVDIVRIDHFRGFESYWEISGGEETAINGEWVPGPKDELFVFLKKELGGLPIIAEDLGIITDEVDALRERLGFPGMRVLQFAFAADPTAEDLKPHNYPENCIVYTGTHDNDTTVGWFWSEAGEGSTRSQEDIEAERRIILEYLRTDGKNIHWDLIALAMRSNANTSIVPLQDVMGLGSEARMNTPGTQEGNWRWRYGKDMLSEEMIQTMRALTEETGR